ncbi:MFS transporter [Lysinibacillus irui]|uniref:MFS transporter n=1 Tax=Lysinibacillus irui TaxID=2998077 RepID=A0ABU5NQB8_9BACI|nr:MULTISPECIES: MFS transporter [Lysinibacillus]MEA0555986.1 MFS transporter [Lysinibacillus irui]MEA0565465.1 MFS transporter [Lysinibacillus irui]MEA0978240.1 MFS transporter [Lysinibacillus irui]MEA1044394.1 MFS transporter [Lysinibacillus irui]
MIINKNFSNLLYGRFLVNMGDSLYYITIMWLIYDLTKNTLFTGVAGALFMLPEIFSVFYGPIIDKCNKKKFLIIFSLLQALLMLVICIFFLYDKGNVLSVILIAIPFLAFLSEFTYPLENVLIPRFVEKNELTKANSIMSIAADGVDLVFNAVSGLLIAITTISSILLGNSLLFLFAAFFFYRLTIKRETQKHQKMNFKESKEEYYQDLKEGLAFVKRKDILELIIPFLMLNLLLAIFNVNLPAISSSISYSAVSYGLLLTASGLGSVAGASISQYISNKFKIGTIIISTVMLYGCAWLIGILLGSFYIYIFAFLASIFIGIINVVFTVLFQQLPPENLLGRVNTTIKTLITIFMPLGALVGGWIPMIFGVNNTILLSSGLIILLGIILLLMSSIRNKELNM